MDAITAKLECLKLAAGRRELTDPTRAVKDAETYWRWVISDDSDSRPSPPSDTRSTS